MSWPDKRLARSGPGRRLSSPEGAGRDKGKEGRGGRSGTCGFKGTESQRGVWGRACGGARLSTGPRGVVCVELLFCECSPPQHEIVKLWRKRKLLAILGTRAPLRSSNFTLPPPAGGSQARLFLSHQPARYFSQTRGRLCRRYVPLRFLLDWRRLFFVYLLPGRDCTASPCLPAPGSPSPRNRSQPRPERGLAAIAAWIQSSAAT